MKTNPKLSKREQAFNRFQNNIFFPPKKREDFKKCCINLSKALEANWSASDEELKEQHLNKEVVVGLSSSTAGFLELIKEAEDWNLKRKLRNKKFKLYNHKSSPKILIEYKFTRSFTGEKAIETWVLPKGLPTKKTDAKAIRYKRSLNKKGYNLTHIGTHFQTLYNLLNGRYILKSTKLTKTLYIQATAEKQYSLSLTKY